MNKVSFLVKLFSFLIFLLPCSSCWLYATLSEKFIFEKEGGRYILILDLSKSRSLIAMCDNYNKEDSFKASIEKKLVEIAEEIAHIPNIHAVKLIYDDKHATILLKFKFKNIFALNSALKLITPTHDGGDIVIWKKGNFLKKPIYIPHMSQLKGDDGDSIVKKGLLKLIFSKITLITVFEFANRKIKNYTDKHVKIQKNMSQIVFKHNLSSFAYEKNQYAIIFDS